MPISFVFVYTYLSHLTATYTRGNLLPYLESPPISRDLVTFFGTALVVLGAIKLNQKVDSRTLRGITWISAILLLPALLLVALALAEPKVTLELAFSRYPLVLLMELLSIVATVVLVAPLVNSREREQALSLQQAELLQFRESAAQQREQAHVSIASRLKTEITPEVDRVLGMLRAGPLDAEKSSRLSILIQEAIVGVIKPFSRTLIADTSSQRRAVKLSDLDSKSTFSLRERVWVGDILLPISIATLVGIVLLGVVFRDSEAISVASTPLFCFAFIVAILVWLASLAFQRCIPKSFRLSQVAAVLVLIGPTTAMFASPFLLIRMIPDTWLDYGTWGFVTDFPNLVPISIAAGVTLTIGGVLNARKLEVINRTSSIANFIEQDVAALRTELWHINRQTALMVHGSLQGALIATGLALQKSYGDEGEITSLIARLEKALSAIQTRSTAEDISHFLDSLVEAWDGVIKVEWHASVGALDSLIRHSPASAAIAEISREGLNNAVFHGGAEMVQIRLAQTPSGAILVVVEDNGSGLNVKSGAGVGSELFNTVATKWTLERWGQTTKLIAEVAVPAMN